MTNRESITNTLNDMNIIYKMSSDTMDNNLVIDTYFMNFIVDNNIIHGGILDGGAPDDRHIAIVFFFNCNEYEILKDKNKRFEKINAFNQKCKYGNFYIDNENDIVYSLSVPAINSTSVDENVFKFYFSSVISIIVDVTKEMIYEQ